MFYDDFGHSRIRALEEVNDFDPVPESLWCSKAEGFVEPEIIEFSGVIDSCFTRFYPR